MADWIPSSFGVQLGRDGRLTLTFELAGVSRAPLAVRLLADALGGELAGVIREYRTASAAVAGQAAGPGPEAALGSRDPLTYTSLSYAPALQACQAAALSRLTGGRDSAQLARDIAREAQEELAAIAAGHIASQLSATLRSPEGAQALAAQVLDALLGRV